MPWSLVKPLRRLLWAIAVNFAVGVPFGDLQEPGRLLKRLFQGEAVGFLQKGYAFFQGERFRVFGGLSRPDDQDDLSLGRAGLETGQEFGGGAAERFFEGFCHFAGDAERTGWRKIEEGLEGALDPFRAFERGADARIKEQGAKVSFRFFGKEADKLEPLKGKSRQDKRVDQAAGAGDRGERDAFFCASGRQEAARIVNTGGPGVRDESVPLARSEMVEDWFQ